MDTDLILYERLQLKEIHSLPTPPTLTQEALEFSPESAELLTNMGLLHLQLGDNRMAFECLGKALMHDPRDPKAILAAG